MPSPKQKKAAKKNIKKAQKKWQSMSKQQRSKAQPKGKARTKPGLGKQGEYYHVVLRPKEEFTTFRTHDIGRPGHALRVAGKRSSGSWATQKWLFSKKDTYVDEQGYLRGKTEEAKKILKRLGSVPRKSRGDRFVAKPRPNVPERKKPTKAQKQARQKNIKKAQKARKKS